MIEGAVLDKAVGTLLAADQSPLRIAGRIAGLGADELDAGVPTWAWLTIALGAGIAVGVIYGPAARSKFARIGRRVRG